MPVEEDNAVEYEIQPSTIETVDFAFYDFMQDQMNIRAATNKGWKKVPIIWSSPERAFFSKNKKELMDLDGTLIYPLISIERTAINKDLTKKGAYYGAAPFFMGPFHGGRIEVFREIVSDKTNNYAIVDNRKEFPGAGYRTPGRQSYYPNPNNKKIVYETISMPMPVYMAMTYVVTLQTNYQQQMNQMLQPFITLGGHINSFLVKRDGHRYETFLKTQNINNNLSEYQQEERIYNTNITFEVLGYVMGEGDNQDRPKIIRRQNAVEVKIPRESVMLGDIPQYGVIHSANSPFYRD